MIFKRKFMNGSLGVSDPVMEFVIFREASDKVIFSADFFNTYTRVTTNSVKSCGSNGAGCGWYIEGSSETALTFHYTSDFGQTWNTTTAPYYARWAVASDSGRYWILSGNTNSGSNYLQKVCIAGTWYSTPTSLYYNGTYGGKYAMISRDGQSAVLVNRSKGLVYNNNFLDTNSWYDGQYENTLSYPINIAPDHSCHINVSDSWDNKVFYKNSFDFSSLNSFSNSNANFSYAFANGVIGFCDTSSQLHYRSVNGGSFNQEDAYQTFIATDDAHTFEFKCNYYASTAIVNGNSISNVRVLSIYVSRDGLNILYVDSSQNKIWRSTNKGASWVDVTPSTSYMSFYARTSQQWNRMIYV